MSLDPREFRNALGSFTTGVCVITATPEGGEPMGMTVNSFASVSLDPALVLWSIQNDSECFPVFENIEKYGINILSAEQMDTSNQYAKKGQHDLLADDVVIGDTGVPLIKGAITSFECESWARYDGGDHQILVAEVKAMRAADGEPLLFFAGGYRELAAKA